MVDKLIELLESFNYPVFRQGSLAPDEPYPETFITFWNRDEADHSDYDNKTALVDWTFTVNVYSSDPDLVYSLLDQVRTLLKSAGFTITDRGYDLTSDEITHVGRGMVVMYLETL